MYLRIFAQSIPNRMCLHAFTDNFRQKACTNIFIDLIFSVASFTKKSFMFYLVFFLVSDAYLYIN
jgi:hypothetical protein